MLASGWLAGNWVVNQKRDYWQKRGFSTVGWVLFQHYILHKPVVNVCKSKRTCHAYNHTHNHLDLGNERHPLVSIITQIITCCRCVYSWMESRWLRVHDWLAHVVYSWMESRWLRVNGWLAHWCDTASSGFRAPCGRITCFTPSHDSAVLK